MMYSFLRVYCSSAQKPPNPEKLLPPSFLKLYFSSTSSCLQFSDTALAFKSSLSIMKLYFAPCDSCSLYSSVPSSLSFASSQVLSLSSQDLHLTCSLNQRILPELLLTLHFGSLECSVSTDNLIAYQCDLL